MKQIVYIGKYLGIVGGIERYMQNSAVLLRKNGFSVHYLYTGEAAGSPEIFSEAFDSVERFSKDASSLKQADLVILHNIIPVEELKHLPEKKTLFFVHDHNIYCRRHHYYTPLGRRNCSRSCHPLRCLICSLGRNPAPPLREYRKFPAIVLSDFMRDNLKKNGFTHIYKLPAFIRTCDTARSFMPDKVLRILFLGQLIRGKGADLMLKALAKLTVPFSCTIAGAGKDMAMLKKMVEQYDLQDKVTFTGFVDDTAKLWQECDLFCFPIRWQEPFGLVGLEAMAHGVPVIAFDHGGVREWLMDKENGFAVRTMEELREKLTCISLQKVLLINMGKRGMEIAVEKFSEESFIKRFHELCQEVQL